MELFSSSMRKLWKEWNLRVAVLLSLTLQILLITLGNRRKHNHKLWISIVVWCVYLSADVIATFALGIITNNVSDIYDEEGGSMDANTELTAFWAPFLLLHLGGPDTITSYALEDNELWLRHFLGLFVQTGMAIYVFIMAWTGSHLSILYLLMFVAGLIKYGERTWVLRKASIETIRESIAKDGINFFAPGVIPDQVDGSVPVKTNFICDAYRLMSLYFRPLFLNVKVPFISGKIIASTTIEQHGFKIIEMALGFMYDNLYTKAPLLYTRCGLGLRVITFFLTTSVLVLFPVAIHYKHKFSNTDVTITYILLVGAIILELYSAVLILSSDLFLVWLIDHKKYSTKKAFEPFLTQKRWSNNMSQFSLLSFIIKEKPLPCQNFLKHLHLDKSLEKQCYVVGMEIPQNLKTLIFWYLQEKKHRNNADPINPDLTDERIRIYRLGESPNHDDHLNITDEERFRFELKLKSRGRLARSPVGHSIDVDPTMRPDFTEEVITDEERFHFNLKLESRGRLARSPVGRSINVDPMGLDFTEELEKSILAWHVATDIRYELDGEDIKRYGPAFELHCGMICQISRYMFYLMILHPSMISDGSMNQITLPSILLAARSREFRNKFEACQHFEELLTKSESYLDQRGLVLEGDNDIKIFLNDKLPGLLRKLSEQMALEERWERISWIWLEMLPYAAIKCTGIQHAQQLKNGGEFLTHVWFLASVLLEFTHKDFTPAAPIFNSVMPLLNRLDLFPGIFDIPEADTNPQV